MPESLLTPKQVAEQLSLSLTAVYALCNSGDLPCCRVGVSKGRIRITPRAVADYLARRQQPVIVELPKTRRQPRPLVGLRHLAGYRDN